MAKKFDSITFALTFLWILFIFLTLTNVFSLIERSQNIELLKARLERSGCVAWERHTFESVGCDE